MSGIQIKPVGSGGGSWSDVELTSAVQAYLAMLDAELRGEAYSKSHFNQQLREGPLSSRTKASIEFRMQNISAALYELKMPRIAGYLPAKNIGSSIKERLISILNANGVEALAAYVPTSDAARLARSVSQLRKKGSLNMPAGSLTPELTTTTTTTYVRDPAVKAWILKHSNGICEGCKAPSPFLGQDGLPYLEVHHVMPLSCHGSDTVSNAVALCPNCHRRCHYALDRDEFKLQLYRSIPRLVLEVPVEPRPIVVFYIPH